MQNYGRLVTIAINSGPLPLRSLPDLPGSTILAFGIASKSSGGHMTPLEKIQSMKMPFAELKGVTFVLVTTEAR